jgi:hypothetical protein
MPQVRKALRMPGSRFVHPEKGLGFRPNGSGFRDVSQSGNCSVGMSIQGTGDGWSRKWFRL